MRRERASWFSVFFSLPWRQLPALLSFLSLGGAATAGAAVGRLLLPLFVLSAGFLAYAHYRVWLRKQGDRVTKIVLVTNSLLAVSLWIWRLPF